MSDENYHKQEIPLKTRYTALNVIFNYALVSVLQTHTLGNTRLTRLHTLDIAMFIYLLV